MRNIFFCLFTFLLGSTTISAQEADIFNATNIPKSLKIGANAVVRLENYQIDIDSQDEMTMVYRRVVTILNEKGNRHLNAAVGYDNDRKIKKIEAVVYDEFGSEIKKIKKKDFIDHSAVDGSTLYSDSRVLFMGYTPLNYPYTVDFSYEVKTPDTAAIPSWQPLNDFYLGVQESHYQLIDNANLGLRFKEVNIEQFDITQDNSATSLSYSVRNAAPFKPEDLSPGFNRFAPKVMVAVERFHYGGVDGQAKNWKEFGDWMQKELLQERSQITEETKNKIMQLTASIDDPLERAKIVYQFVQDNTRYISVQVGIGGIQPIKAMEVDQLKYGDCKGLTNYTQALLRAANVDSYYTVVEAGSSMVDFDEDFASLEQGNHIILCIPQDDDLIWLDCTSQIHPFGFVGDFTDSRNVLVVKPEGSEIVKTVVYPDTDNSQVTTAEVSINTDASITATVVIKTQGIQYDNRFYVERQSERDLEKHYKSYWSYINNLDIQSKAFDNDTETVEFTETLQLNARDYASINGDRLIFMPNAFNRNTFVPDRYRNRKFPMLIQRGYFDEDKFTFKVPQGYEVEALPEKVEINNKYGEYMVEYTIKNDTIEYHRRLLIKHGDYPKTEYNAYRDFRKDISKNDTSIIVLKKII